MIYEIFFLNLIFNKICCQEPAFYIFWSNWLSCYSFLIVQLYQYNLELSRLSSDRKHGTSIKCAENAYIFYVYSIDLDIK